MSNTNDDIPEFDTVDIPEFRWRHNTVPPLVHHEKKELLASDDPQLVEQTKKYHQDFQKWKQGRRDYMAQLMKTDPFFAEDQREFDRLNAIASMLKECVPGVQQEKAQKRKMWEEEKELGEAPMDISDGEGQGTEKKKDKGEKKDDGSSDNKRVINDESEEEVEVEMGANSLSKRFKRVRLGN
jgi:hypothetical protein